MIDYGIDVPNELVCLPNTMYVEKLEVGERKTKSGIYIPEEKMDAYGNFVRPRWARVIYKADNIKDINVGDFCLFRHGHWSSSILINNNGTEKKIWFISPKSYKEGLLAVSRIEPPQMREFI